MTLHTELPLNSSMGAEIAELDALELLATDGGKIVLLVSGILMLAFVLGNMLHRFHVTWLPESLVVVFLGALVGLILPMGRQHVSEWTLRQIEIHEESVINEIVLNWFLLPMIIFEAGWSLRHRDFLSQFPYILLFAIFGTLISMTVVGSLILATSDIHGVSQPRVAFAYAALISAVDPVATLATYQHLNVDPLLNCVVFGESVINDAVAIVLFKTLNDLPVAAYDGMSGGEMAGRLTSGVLQLLTCSLGLGLFLGVCYTVIIRFTKLGHSTPLCAMFIFFSCFFTYNLAESVMHQSGIIAVLFCGMLMGGYATPHLSSEGVMFTSFLLKQMASFADMIVFLFVGTAAVYVSPNGLQLGGWVILFCLLGRAAATFPLGLVANFVKATVHKSRPEEQRHMLSWQHIVMMWHAGLRGGIALVLTLELGDWVDEIDGPGTREALRNCTVIVICAFLLFFGGSTEFMLRLLGIPVGGTVDMVHHSGQVKNIMTKMTSRVLMPVLVGDSAGKCEDEEKGVCVDVLEEANVVAAGGPPVRASTITSDNAYERYQMFGTYDPTHAAEVGASRRRANSASKGAQASVDEGASVSDETASCDTANSSV